MMAKDVMMLNTAETVNGQRLSIRNSSGSVMVDNAKVVKTRANPGHGLKEGLA